MRRDQAEAELELPARDRPGKAALLGPISLGAALLSWVVPGVDLIIAVVAVCCGVLSIITRHEYRVDWTAVAGICVGVGQLFAALVMFTMTASGL